MTSVWNLLSLFIIWFLKLGIAGVALLVTVVWICRWRAHWIRSRQQRRRNRRDQIWAFFHPHCSGGGGGERVLWKALEVLGTYNGGNTNSNRNNKKEDNTFVYHPPEVLIYTIDPPTPHYAANLLRDAQERFDIQISDKLKIQFVHLHEYKHLLAPSPRLSLIVESLGALRLAWHGLQQSAARGQWPHVFWDTTGCAFTFLPASLLFGCRIVAYVHYPTISTDMLQMVWQRRRAAYNHSAAIASSRAQTALKMVYYMAFAALYGLVGSLATLVMVNSTWTYRHIAFLWKLPAWTPGALRIVYPPCAVQDLQSLVETPSHLRQAAILSIGQFRPEKDHVLQIQALQRLLEQHPELKTSTTKEKVKLVLLGSCRNDDDRKRLTHLQVMARDNDLEEHVEFCVNQPYRQVRHWLGCARVGIHTMWNEHFGIGIVEMMAAGLLVVAHNSGGPQTDILTDHATGFLAATVDEYADALYKALTMPNDQAIAMQKAAQKSSQRFSDQAFAYSFQQALEQAKIL